MRVWIILLGLLGIVTTRALGFTMDRSSAGASGPAIWSNPSLDSDRRASVDMLLNGKLYAVDLDNILRDFETKKSTKEETEKCSSSSEESQRLKRSEGVLLNGTHLTDLAVNLSKASESSSSESIVSESKESTVESSNSSSSESIGSEAKESTVESSSSSETETSAVTAEKTSANEAPRNVVLLLIDDAGIARETMWKNFESAHKFTVQGFLQNCRIAELRESSKFPLSESLVSGRINEDCECDRFLRSNVETLLSWARHVKEMNIATVSATNFSIPSAFGSDAPTIQVKEFEDNEEINALGQDVPRLRPDIRHSWHMIDLDKQSTPSASSASVASGARQDGINGYDGMWDVFDMFSRIRIAFFRILLESLGNLSGPEDEFAGQRALSVQPSIVELFTDAIKDVKSVPNDKGFVLVTAAPGNELSAAVDLLRREITSKDTLIVVAGICSKMNEPIPFFADGPGDKSLREARAVWDLPGLIRSAISNGCPDKICSNERVPEPVALPSLEFLSLPQNVPHKRIARAKEDEETSDSTTDEKSTKEIVEDVEENKSTPETGKRSENGVEKMRVDGLAAIFGIATSVTAMLALNS